MTTEAVRGTVNWTPQAAEFDAPHEGGVVSVHVMRKPSLKFDKLVSGQLWIDAVTIEPAPPERAAPGQCFAESSRPAWTGTQTDLS